MNCDFFSKRHMTGKQTLYMMARFINYNREDNYSGEQVRLW